ncbi:hypothetical protein [Syntrophomonas erecta]
MSRNQKGRSNRQGWQGKPLISAYTDVFSEIKPARQVSPSLANCPSASVRREIADIQYNIPELFVD